MKWSAPSWSSSIGGQVILVDLVPGHSTTDMVKRTRAPKTR